MKTLFLLIPSTLLELGFRYFANPLLLIFARRFTESIIVKTSWITSFFIYHDGTSFNAYSLYFSGEELGSFRYFANPLLLIFARRFTESIILPTPSRYFAGNSFPAYPLYFSGEELGSFRYFANPLLLIYARQLICIHNRLLHIFTVLETLFWTLLWTLSHTISWITTFLITMMVTLLCLFPLLFWRGVGKF